MQSSRLPESCRQLEILMRFAQLETSRAHRFFESSAVIVEQNVEPPRLKRSGDAKNGLELVEWFDQELRRTGAEGTAFGLLVYVRRQHNDRRQNVRGRRPQRVRTGEAVGVRHHHI